MKMISAKLWGGRPLVELAVKLGRIAPWGRNAFTQELFHELEESFLRQPISLKSDPAQLHYINFRSVIVEDTLLSREVAVSFKLQPHAQINLTRLQNLVGRLPENATRSYRFELHPGAEMISDQIFFFSFTSFESVPQNLLKFRSFIDDAYVSRDVAREAYRRRAQELKRLAADTFGRVPVT